MAESAMDPLEVPFDVVILETGLCQSILAAALSQAGYRVLHLDSNSYYGSSNASLSIEELIQWSFTRPADYKVSCRFPSSDSPDPPSSLMRHSKSYSVSLSPSVVLSGGILTNFLVQSGVSKYGGFQLLEGIGVVESNYSKPCLREVPMSKEDIFVDSSLSLVSKRKLMKLLQFAMGPYEDSETWRENRGGTIQSFLHQEFGIPSDLAVALIYAVAMSSDSDESIETVFLRLRRYLLSAGHYGKSPFLFGHYGGLGDIAQGFCRMSAVHGGTYVLGRSITSVRPIATEGHLQKSWEIRVQGLQLAVNTSLIAGTPNSLCKFLNKTPESTPSSCTQLLRGVLILDSSLDVLKLAVPKMPHTYPNTFMVVIPPGAADKGTLTTSVSFLISGEDSHSAPPGKVIVYICAQILTGRNDIDPETSLRPYIDTVFGLTPGTSPLALLELFYAETINIPSSTQEDFPPGIVLIESRAPPTATLVETGEVCAQQASSAISKIAERLGGKDGTLMFPSMWSTNNYASEGSL